MILRKRAARTTAFGSPIHRGNRVTGDQDTSQPLTEYCAQEAVDVSVPG